MSLTAFTSAELIRERINQLDLLAADVYIAKGNDMTLPADIASFKTYLGDPMKTIGVNTKDSPSYVVEDIVEEVDYEVIKQGVKITGEIKVKLINAGLMTFIEEELPNVEVTVLIVPKNYVSGDQCLFIAGVKLKTKIEGKSNSETSPEATFSFMTKAKKMSDVISIVEVPTGI